jgi:hypothetical protein
MRYKVINESVSAHCCFEATVVDTGTPNPAYPDRARTVCECFSRSCACQVARALNAEEESVSQGLVDACVAAALLEAGDGQVFRSVGKASVGKPPRH